MKNLQALFEHQLQDLYSAEDQLIQALPKIAKKAKSKKLKKVIQDHLKETKEHKKRLKNITGGLNIDPDGDTCKAMEGLISEAESFLGEDADDDVQDAGIIAEIQRMEHYEISGYGTAAQYARELEHLDVARLLYKTLDEEYEADKKLNDLAEDRINARAQ